MSTRCGTRSAYVKGCRCEPCTAANRDHARDWRAANPGRVGQWRDRYRTDNAERLREKRRRYDAAHREQRLAYQRRWTDAHRAYVQHQQRRALERRYGLAEGEYDRLVEAQGGGCAICAGPPSGRHRTFHIDHDHAAGAVRGLLCESCNLGLGKFRDDPIRLARAVAYLEAR